MQKHVNLVDLVKSFPTNPTNIYLQNLASIQKTTSPLKFAHLAEKSENGSVSNLSTKVPPRVLPARRGRRGRDPPRRGLTPGPRLSLSCEWERAKAQKRSKATRRPRSRPQLQRGWETSNSMVGRFFHVR